MKTLDQQQAAFDDSNSLIPLLMGLVSFLDEFSACIEHGQSVPGAAPPQNDRLADAMLGMLALHRSIHRWVDSIPPVDPGAGAGDDEAKDIAGGELLR